MMSLNKVIDIFLKPKNKLLRKARLEIYRLHNLNANLRNLPRYQGI